LKNRTILVGDVLEKITEIPDECIDCIITSPPYWNLRDYGIDNQWGLEKDFHVYLLKMKGLMKELKRVLKPTGSCWINLGDTYNGTGDHTNVEDFGKQNTNFGEDHLKLSGHFLDSVGRKSRYGIPERFYIQCIDDGWIARNHIPWIKANAMPTSVKDRFQNKWESVFFFTKQPKYYFNLDAVREEHLTQDVKPFNIRVRDNITGKAQQKLGDLAWTASEKEKENYQDERVNKGIGNQKLFEKKQDNTLGGDGKPIPTYTGFNERYEEKEKGKNPGDIFNINPRPFTEAHFATFPLELPMRILKCACPIGGFVLDPFFGSGTVGLAAEKLNIQWIGIEINQKYVDEIIRKRLAPYNTERMEAFS